MTLATTPCSERIAPATLAAWHDGTLPDAEAARVAAHVPTCRACHAELAAYETMDAALRRHPALEPDGRLWHAVRDAMTGRRRMQYTDTSVRRLTGSLIALAAVVLLVLGFAQLLHNRSVYIPANPITRTPTPAWTDFSHVPATPVATPGPKANFIQSVVTAMNFDRLKKIPISPTSHFRINTFVYVVATVRNIPKGESHTVTIHWFLQGQYLDLLGVSDDTTKTIKEDELIDFALFYPSPGLGMAKIYFDRPDSDKGDDPNDPSLAATIYFAVGPTPAQGTTSSGSPRYPLYQFTPQLPAVPASVRPGQTFVVTWQPQLDRSELVYGPYTVRCSVALFGPFASRAAAQQAFTTLEPPNLWPVPGTPPMWPAGFPLAVEGPMLFLDDITPETRTSVLVLPTDLSPGYYLLDARALDDRVRGIDGFSASHAILLVAAAPA